MALHNYHETYSCFPPGLTGNNSGPTNNAGRLSAFFGMLPYFDQMAMYNTITSHPFQGEVPWNRTAWWTTNIGTLQCPSDVYRKRDQEDKLCLQPWGPSHRARASRAGAGPRPVRRRDTVRHQGHHRRNEQHDRHVECRKSVSYGGDSLEAIGYPRTSAGTTPMAPPSLCLTYLAEGSKTRWATPNTGINTNRGREDDGETGVRLHRLPTILPPNSPSCVNSTNDEDPDNAIYSAASVHAGGVNVLMADASHSLLSDNIDTGDLSAAPPRVSRLPVPTGSGEPSARAASAEKTIEF